MGAFMLTLCAFLNRARAILVRGFLVTIRQPACWVGAILLAYICFRSVTLDFCHDEALSFELFVSGGLYKLFGPYDASNHILYSVLARLSRGVFGLSAFSLRFPSLLAAIVFLLAAVSFVRHWISNTWWRAVALVLLAGNPLLLDHFSAARGYGLGCAFLAWSIVLTCRLTLLDHCLVEQNRSVYMLAVALGLSVSSNLVFLTSALAIAAWVTVVFLANAVRKGTPRAALASLYANGFAAPAAFLPAVFWVLPLRTATPANFYVGFQKLVDFRESITGVFFPPGVHGWDFLETIGTLVHAAASVVPVLELVLGLTILALGVIGFHWVRNRPVSLATANAATACAILALTVGINLVLWQFFGVKLPVLRTTLPLVVTFNFAFVAGLAALAQMDFPRRLLGAPLFASAAMLLISDISATPRSYLFDWPYDSQNVEIVGVLEQESQKLGHDPTVLTSYYLSRSLRWYGERKNLSWLKNVPFPWEQTRPPKSYDFVVLYPNDPIPNFVPDSPPWRRWEISGVEVYRNP